MVFKKKYDAIELRIIVTFNIFLPHIFLFSFNWVAWISNCYFVGRSIVTPFLINKVEVEIEEILLK